MAHPLNLLKKILSPAGVFPHCTASPFRRSQMSLVTLNPVFNSFHGRVGGIVFVYRRGSQRARRRVFADAVRAWQSLPEAHKTAWNTRTRRTNSNGYNAFISWYMREGRRKEGNGEGFASCADSVFRANYIGKPGTFASSRAHLYLCDITAPFQALSILYPGSGTRLPSRR